jgi:ubiquinone/menaquinone biosynthesis C-methylase UbiE
MSDLAADRRFAGSVPEIYEALLVPLIFEPYAQDLARRIAARSPSRLLEVAAGTGVVTRALASGLPEATSIVATDLNQPMLDRAQLTGTARAVEWRQADAMNLPFADASFDVLVCQFGAMFFPDKSRAFAEAKRVLKPAGALIFNVWDRIEVNDFANVVSEALVPLFPEDPPRFLARTPYGYGDPERIARDLVQAGFTVKPEIVTVTERSRAESYRTPAAAFCLGTPLRNEIESRDATKLTAATDAAAAALAARFGSGPIDGRIQALVVVVTA